MQNIIEKLIKQPEQFDFYQAVRILEEAGLAYRFKHNPSLVFPVADIHKVSQSDKVLEISVNFMGLIGPTSVLPNHYTALAIARIQRKDYTLCHFLDIFQHRLVSLFYSAWKKNHFYTDLQPENKFSQTLLSLMGQGTPCLYKRKDMPDQIMLHYAAYFSKRRASVTGLESVLSDYFKVNIAVAVFQPKTLQLPKNQQTALNRYNLLGIDAACGHHQLQYQYHFRLVIGALNMMQFMSFLPDQPRFNILVLLTRRCVSVELTFDIQLKLSADAVPYCKLGGVDTGRLGWTTWLKQREFSVDADNTILNVRETT